MKRILISSLAVLLIIGLALTLTAFPLNDLSSIQTPIDPSSTQPDASSDAAETDMPDPVNTTVSINTTSAAASSAAPSVNAVSSAAAVASSASSDAAVSPQDPPKTSAALPPSSSAPSDNTDLSDAAELLDLLNTARAKEGLPPLSGSNAKLNAAAQQRAKECAQNWNKDHLRPDGSACFTVLDEFGIAFVSAGENIARGQTSPQQVFEGWMGSPGHRSNIMDHVRGFTHVGIGGYIKDNIHYWVQHFIRQV